MLIPKGVKQVKGLKNFVMIGEIDVYCLLIFGQGNLLSGKNYTWIKDQEECNPKILERDIGGKFNPRQLLKSISLAQNRVVIKRDLEIRLDVVDAMDK